MLMKRSVPQPAIMKTPIGGTAETSVRVDSRLSFRAAELKVKGEKEENRLTQDGEDDEQDARDRAV